MLLWVLLALMTGAVVLVLLWPLSRAAATAAYDGDVEFYKGQLAEIERDQARGLIGSEDAEAARVESGRRLLRASASVRASANATSEPALRRRRAASALALCVVPIVGLGVYGGYGSPELQATAPAGQPTGSQAKFDDALKQVEQHLTANPGDVRGWDVVAPIYLRIGRFSDALKAYGVARERGGDNPARLLGEAEARIALGKGMVVPEARSLLEAVVAREPSSVPARYYLALAREQAGDRDAARAAYRDLLFQSEGGAPWVPLLRSRLSRLDEGGGTLSVPTISAVAVTPEIHAMVGGLDERLKTSGGSEAEWSRLVRSLVVLGRRDDASDRLAKAKAALASDPEAPGRLDRLAGDLGLTVAAGQAR
jgi:cytochrome c-type biogenesis protein CcmH